MGLTDRNVHDEGCAAINFTLDLTVPPWSFTSSWTRAARFRTFVTATARAFHAMKTLEEVRQLFRGNARSGVAHRRARFFHPLAEVTMISPSNVNLNAFESKLKTIFSHISRST